MSILTKNKVGKSAIIIGASSGIGAALAKVLIDNGWRLGLAARRLDKLNEIACQLSPYVITARIDVTHADAVIKMEALADSMNGVDLIIISAGTGHINPELDKKLDHETVSVNVVGFMELAIGAIHYFKRQGSGHLVAITSVGALRGNGRGASYAASKSFQSIYLDGLRALMKESGSPILVTELQPGFVDTAMLKTDAPLSPLVRKLLVKDAVSAARQMMRAIVLKKKHAYITRRYVVIAWLMRLLPRP